MKQILCNLLLFAVEILIMTGSFMQPKTKLYAGLSGVVLFWIVNACFLRQTDRKNPRTLQEYQYALRFWQKKSNPFHREIRTAIQQLNTFSQKQDTMNTFAVQNRAFCNLNEEVRTYLLANMQNMLNRMMILNLQDDLQAHRNYLSQILEQNQKILSQYDKLMLEISQLMPNEMPCLETVTEALRELRNT